MKVAVFGAGAIGSFVGGLLSRKNEVTLIARPPHVDAIRQNGLVVVGLMDEVFRPQASCCLGSLSVQDMVLVTVKAYDTKQAAHLIRPLVGERTLVISLQNGLNNRDILRQMYGNQAIAALTSIGITCLSPGKIRFAGRGETILEDRKEHRAALEAVRDALELEGIPTRVVKDIVPEIWMKAIVNASINPITALTRKSNGCILKDQGLLYLSEKLCEEACKAAWAKRIDLPEEEPFERVRQVISSTAENRSSMLQDLEQGKRTEIDEITGEIVRQGEEAGISLPYNRLVYSLVKGASSSC